MAIEMRKMKRRRMMREKTWWGVLAFDPTIVVALLWRVNIAQSEGHRLTRWTDRYVFVSCTNSKNFPLWCQKKKKQVTEYCQQMRCLWLVCKVIIFMFSVLMCPILAWILHFSKIWLKWWTDGRTDIPSSTDARSYLPSLTEFRHKMRLWRYARTLVFD